MTGLWWKAIVAVVGLLVGLNTIGIPMPWAVNARLDAVEVRLGNIERVLDRLTPLAAAVQAQPPVANQSPAPAAPSLGGPPD